MNDPLTLINTRATPQTEKADPRQVRNNAGGYAFAASTDTRLRRFLTIGTTGGTYYVGEAELTRDNAQIVLDAARNDGVALVDLVLEVSEAGRAPRQNPGIFALAAVAGLGDDVARKAALDAIGRVCRTGTTLFQFLVYVQQFRGWGKGLHRGVSAWYLDKSVDQLAYQVVKYRQRLGWTHADVLRKVRPSTNEPARKALFNWIVNGGVETSRAPGPVGAKGAGEQRAVGATDADLPGLVKAFERAQQVTTVPAWLPLVAEYPLSWEMLPDAALAHPQIWMELIR